MSEEVKIIDPCADPRWDRFVQNHPRGWIVHLSGWKTAIENAFPHMKGHFLALIDSETGVINAGMPVYEIRSWLTGNRLVSIPFASICDPLILNRQQSDALTASAFSLLENLGFSYMEVRTLQTNPLINNHLKDTSEYKHHYLDLSGGPEDIWKNISYKSIRYLINKAAKNKLQLKYASNEEDIRSFYTLYAATRKRLGLPAQPYLFFKTLYDLFSPTGNVIILLALSGQNVVAGHLLFKFNDRVSAEASGEDARYRHLNTNQFLYWEGIKSACAEGYKIYDFGRTSAYNTTLTDFKRRWGTRQTDIHTFFYDKNTKAPASTNRENSTPYKVIRYICQNSPDAIQTVLSRFCYRHLG
ncbi:MAG: GNAT family N-acetyltransferase [Smithellaceae bacterium]